MPADWEDMNLIDLLKEVLDTGFIEFDEGPIHGMQLVQGDILDVLAVYSDNQGRGEFRHWLESKMQAYRIVRFLHVESPRLQSILAKMGFVESEWFHCGEHVTGMRWRREQQLTLCDRTAENSPGLQGVQYQPPSPGIDLPRLGSTP